MQSLNAPKNCGLKGINRTKGQRNQQTETNVHDEMVDWLLECLRFIENFDHHCTPLLLFYLLYPHHPHLYFTFYFQTDTEIHRSL